VSYIQSALALAQHRVNILRNTLIALGAKENVSHAYTNTNGLNENSNRKIIVAHGNAGRKVSAATRRKISLGIRRAHKEKMQAMEARTSKKQNKITAVA
jgi:hypothetical protein